MLTSSLVVSLVAFASLSTALPLIPHERRGTALKQVDSDALIPFGQFARAAYCPTDKIQGWQCGQACDALPGFNATLVGGDGNAIQNFFVGHWPDQNTIVVAHEGTDPLELQSDLTDAKFFQVAADKNLFPGAPSTMKVHNGFRDEHAKTAEQIFAEVQSLLASTGANSVVTVGHSLGGALAILEGLSLRLRLSEDVTVSTRTFGAPRIGNEVFAQLVDSKVPDLKRVNNQQDLVPTVPGRFLGFSHPQGEIHLLKDGSAIACNGDDNGSDAQCTNQAVPTILQGSIPNHLGPYLGQSDLSMGTIFCT